MSEPLRKPVAEAVRPERPLPQTGVADPLLELLPAIVVAEDNDNEGQLAPREGERRGFEIPARIWWSMVACYGVFLAALLAATGSSPHAIFMIVVSLGYVVMFFGLTKLMVHHGPAQTRSPLIHSGSVLQTVYGPLRSSEVAAQMLIVPLAVAFFGVAILAIRVVVA